MSAATVDLSSREILVQVSFAPTDLAGLTASSRAEIAEQSVELAAGPTRLQPASTETREVGADNVEFTLRYPRPAAGAVTFRAPLLARLPFGHRQAVTLRDESGATLATELLSADHDQVSLPPRAPSAAHPPSRNRGLLAAGVLVALGFGWFAVSRRQITAAA